MENLDCFLLLQLPYVALKEVFSIWNPFEIVNFSLINATTKAVTKQFTKSKTEKYEVLLITLPNPKISFHGSEFCWRYEMTKDELRDGRRTDGMNEERIEKFVEDIATGYIKWSKYVLEVMNCRIHAVLFVMKNPTENIKSIIDWIGETGTIDVCEIYGRHDADDLVPYFLNRIQITERLTFFADSSENVQERNENWMPLERLLSIDTREIFVTNSTFTSLDLKEFLKSWMTSQTNSSLKRFETMIRDENSFNELFQMLNSEAKEKEPNEFKLMRNDGRRATVSTKSYPGKQLFYVKIEN